MTKRPTEGPETALQSASRRDGEARLFESDDLFSGTKEILIRHAETIYRMRITRQGKLILNK